MLYDMETNLNGKAGNGGEGEDEEEEGHGSASDRGQPKPVMASAPEVRGLVEKEWGPLKMNPEGSREKKEEVPVCYCE